MAGRRLSTPQAEFWRGELRPEITGITDPRKVLQGLRTATNTRPLETGQLTRRPGSVFVVSPGGQSVLTDFVTASGTALILAFSDATLAAFRLTDGFKVSELTGQPWAAADLATLTFASDGDKLYVASQSFWTQVLEYDEATATWTANDYAFGDGVGGSRRQPYYKFDDAKTITLSVSAYTGSGVTVTASAALFSAAYVGTRIRWGFRELEITGFTNPTTVTADVIDRLPNAYDVTVGDASGFRVGEVVIGDQSGAQGQITSITFGTNLVRIVILDGFGGPINTEALDGPNHSTTVSGAPALVVSPPASLIWDEQFISAARGFPGSVSTFRRRLAFTDFPQKKSAIFLSAANDFTDGAVEEGEARSAILDFVQSAGESRIFYAVEAENLMLLANDRVWYVPDDATFEDITPETISFKKVEETGAAQVRPVLYGDTVVFVESGGNRVMGVVPTGQLRRPWRIEHLTRDSSHLLSGPVGLAVTAGNSENPERYVFVVNADGSMTLIHRQKEIDEDGVRVDIIGCFPWNTQGAYKSVTSVSGVIYAALTRTVNSVETWMIERFDYGRLVDSSPFSEDATTLLNIVDWTGDPFVDWTGDPFVFGIESLVHLAGETVAVIEGNRDYGDFTVELDGTISDPSLDGVAYDAGLAFTVTISPYVVHAEDSRRKGTRRTAVKKFAVDIYETVGLTINGEELPRQTLDDLDDEPTPLTGTFWVRVLGVKLGEHDVTITQPRPGALTLRSQQAEIAY